MTTKKFVFVLLAVILGALALPFVYHPSGTQQAGPGMPWEVEALPNGASRVFGLELGASTLSDASVRLGGEPEMAIIAGPGEGATLEAYFESVSLGFVTGKMVLTAALPNETLLEMEKRAVNAEPQASGARRFGLSKADWHKAGSARVSSITLIPAASLDEAIVLARFGRPIERLRTSETVEHFLYPERGVDVSLDSTGKTLLQYVAPAQFSRLREPLLAKR